VVESKNGFQTWWWKMTAKPEPLTKEKIIAEKYENFFREQDVKSAVQGLLQEIEKEKHEIGKEWANLPYRRNPLQKEYLRGYVDGLVRASIKIKKWFPDVVVEDENETI